MRFVQRNLWPCLALLLTGCSLVVDFPEPRDAGLGTDDSGIRFTNCDLGTHEPCRDDELCCPVVDGRKKACVKKSSEKCTSCGSEGACTDPAANRCGKDGCECEPGTGKACSGDLRCSTATDKPPSCVGCDVDGDCDALGNTAQCVDHECRMCDRGDPNDPLDDEGCPPNTPICNENYQCQICSGPSDCPAEQKCNGSQGCFGCSITEPIGENGCMTATRPVCLQIGGDFQCAGCRGDTDCGSGNFCDERTGQCTPVCAPYGPFGSNGCPMPGHGYCREATGGGFACQQCIASDCMGTSKPHCSTEAHPLRGQCVQCLGDGDCMAGQVCDLLNRSCRAPMAADCKPPLPALMGNTCVECTTDAHCGGTLPPYCNTATNKCVGCDKLPSPDMACMAKFPTTAPVCNTGSGRCVRCTTNAQCSGTTPICSTSGSTSNTCVACTTQAQCMGNPAGSSCVTGGQAGVPIGSCAACNPGGGGGGCTNPATPFCNVISNVPTCGNCLPGDMTCGATVMCPPSGICPTSSGPSRPTAVVR